MVIFMLFLIKTINGTCHLTSLCDIAVFTSNLCLTGEKANSVCVVNEACAYCPLVGFGFNDPLKQCFSLYRAVSQREGERGKKG